MIRGRRQNAQTNFYHIAPRTQFRPYDDKLVLDPYHCNYAESRGVLLIFMV